MPPHHVRRQFCWGWASGSSDTQTHRAMAGRCAALLSAPSEEKKGSGGNLYCLRPRLSSPQLFIQPERRVPSQRDASKRCTEFRIIDGLVRGLLAPPLQRPNASLCSYPKSARNGPLGWFVVSRGARGPTTFWPSIKLIFILPS